jgi:hypothetical protein
MMPRLMLYNSRFLTVKSGEGFGETADDNDDETADDDVYSKTPLIRREDGERSLYLGYVTKLSN